MMKHFSAVIKVAVLYAGAFVTANYFQPNVTFADKAWG
jgi:hypothetical protein